MINYINLVFEQFGAKPEYILNFIIGLPFKLFMEHKIPVIKKIIYMANCIKYRSKTGRTIYL